MRLTAKNISSFWLLVNKALRIYRSAIRVDVLDGFSVNQRVNEQAEKPTSVVLIKKLIEEKTNIGRHPTFALIDCIYRKKIS